MGDQKKDIPPSFQPSQSRQRPSASDAKPVSSRRASRGKRAGVERQSATNGHEQRNIGGRQARSHDPSRRRANARDRLESRVPRQGSDERPSLTRRPVNDDRPVRRVSARNLSDRQSQNRSLPPRYEPHDRSRRADGARVADAQLPPSYAPRNRRERTGEPGTRYQRGDLRGAHIPTRSSNGYSDPTTYPVADRRRNAEFARDAGLSGASRSPQRRRRHPLRRAAMVLVVLLILILAWPVGLLWWASSKIHHVDALNDSPATAGTTYLLTGSDERDGDSPVTDSTEGRRSDTIILLHKAPNGQTSLVSLPRDTWTEVPGYGNSKLNASYAWGGEKLLVQTVENLTGLHVDHFAEVGMGGFTRIVDAVDGVELCLDYAVDDPSSGLTWPGGCHHADGDTALAFARMRYADPLGDIGRAARQRQVMSAVLDNALSRDTVINPVQQVKVAGSGAAAVTTDPNTSAFDLGKIALGVRKASKDGLMGAPPISNLGLPTAAGLAVELDPEKIDDFFARLRDGTLTPDDFDTDK